MGIQKGKQSTTGRKTSKQTAAERAEELELERIETLVDAVRARPEDFPDPTALGSEEGFSVLELAAALRKHYHRSPEDLLQRARLDRAKFLLTVERISPKEVAEAVGYESNELFAEDFVRFNGMSLHEFARIGETTTFSIQLPDTYSMPYLRRALGRDQVSVTEKLAGNVYQAGVRIGAEPHRLTMHLGPGRVKVSLDRPSPDMQRVHALVVGLLGLDQDSVKFYHLAGELGLARLVAGRKELRISQTHSVFDGLLWTIIGQQINLSFASVLRRRLMEQTGTPLGDELFAPPTSETVAALEPCFLYPFQYSRQKADYVVSASRLVLEGSLDLEKLRAMSATRAARTLLAVRGIGPWSVNFLMMRALGFPDCLPLGDTGVRSGVQSLFGLEDRPDLETVVRLMKPFSPYRSLATAHLWQLHLPVPDEIST